VDALDRYLRAQAGQDMRRRIANCFVAAPLDTTSVAGYYTLSAASIPVVDLPEDVSRRLPRYPVIPAALIGRLAVDRQYRRRGLGAALLFDALERAIRADAAVFAVIVDAKDETAPAFYARYGFRRFASRSQRPVSSNRDCNEAALRPVPSGRLWNSSAQHRRHRIPPDHDISSRPKTARP
jgi:ribosomal protein S18 acetylase RimI-like enzyme